MSQAFYREPGGSGPESRSGIVDFSLRRRVTVVMLTVAAVLFGVVSFTRLGVDLLPKLSLPSLTIETEFPGAAPAEVESLVTRPIEEAVGVVSGVQRLTSVSRGGVSRVTLEFGWGRSMDFAAIDVRQKLDLVRKPEGSQAPVLLRLDPANDPVMRLYLTGSSDLIRLRELAEYQVEKDLESTEGVAAIEVHGGYEREIEILVDEAQLAGFALDPGDLQRALEGANVDRAGGSLYEKEARYLVRSRNALRDLAEIEAIPIVLRDGASVRVGQVAQVRWGHRRRDTVIRHDGQEAVELAIYREGDANIVEVAAAVHRRVEAVAKSLPHGHRLVVASDQSRFIQASIDEVISGALVGGGFAVLVLLLFLADLRATALIAVCMPVSIAVTFFAMQQTSTSLNLMSLGGLALGVGMLVDNSIVVLEAIYRRRELGDSALDAARTGAAEVARAVTASTLTTVVVFVPVVFLEGIAAQLFRDMAVTVSFSLLASLMVSLTLIPMLAALVGIGAGTKNHQKPPVDPLAGAHIGARSNAALLAGIYTLTRALLSLLLWPVMFAARAFRNLVGVLESGYEKLLRACLRHRVTVLCGTLVVSWLVAETGRELGVDLIPNFAAGEFAVVVELEEGTPVEVTDRELRAMAQALADASDLEDEVAEVAAISGMGAAAMAAAGGRGEQIGRIQIRLADSARADAEARVVELLRASAHARGVTDFRVVHSTYFSLRRPIEIEVYSEDMEQLVAVAGQLAEGLAEIEGTRDVESSVRLAGRELELHFDGERLRRLGLTPNDVAELTRNKLQGQVATRVQRGDRDIDVRVAVTAQGTADLERLRKVIVAQREGVPVFLESVATINAVRGPSEIRRIGQQRSAIVSANVLGRDVGSVTADVEAQLADFALPPSVTLEVGGQNQEMSRSLGSLVLGVALACFLVYLVMASQFESFAQPFVVIASFPFAGVGVILALGATGHSLSVVALIGVVMLAGIVVNNAIVLVDAINQRRDGAESAHEAIIAAAKSRLRPILMTTATTVLGLSPMAFGTGPGAELRASMAVTVIGGLSVGTLCTLILVPIFYGLVDLERGWARRRAEPDSPLGGPPPTEDSTAYRALVGERGGPA